MNKLSKLASPELGSEGPQSLHGPTFGGELCKQSEHIKEWRSRYYILSNRRLYYYNNIEEAGEAGSNPGLAGTQGQHKAFLDMVGATIEEFEDEDSDGHWFGLEIREEFAVRGIGRVEEAGQCHRVVTSLEAQRANWAELLRYASRPAWVADGDPRAETCMESGEKFSKLSRKQYCRACGGVFMKVNVVKKPLPQLLYAEPVTVCRACDDGSKRRSRWIEKVPVEARSNKEKKAHEAATDAVVGGAVRGMKGLMNRGKRGLAKASKAAADATGIDALAVDVKLQLNHSGYMTKLGAIRKNWKRRWFSLDGEGEGVLVYYADEANGGKTKQGVDEKGRVDMREVQSIESSPNDPQRIILKTANRTWQFRADDAAAKEKWLAVLQATRDKHVPQSMAQMAMSIPK